MAGIGTVVQTLTRGGSEPSRFGFVVSKAVGNAVTRNLVKRRMRAAGAAALVTLPVGADVVVRALPASAHLDWVSLHSEIIEGVTMGAKRA